MKAGVNGVTEKTPSNIMFGAGTIHKGLKYADGSWNFAASCIGATSGGSKFSITPEVVRPEIDGVLVAIKNTSVKVGETASMEINLIELSKDVLKAATMGNDGTSTDDDFDLIESKGAIESGDYWENIAFVGQRMDGEKIIVIMDNALCTSGFSPDAKNKEAAIPALTFECHADAAVSVETLPWHIYYPKEATPEPEPGAGEV